MLYEETARARSLLQMTTAPKHRAKSQHAWIDSLRLSPAISLYRRQSLLLNSLPCKLCFPPQCLQIPGAAVIIVIVIFFLALFPPSLLEECPTRSVFLLSCLFLSSLLVEPFLLPYGKSFGVDRGEVFIAKEFRAFGFEEVFKCEIVDGRFICEGFFDGSLFLGFQNEAVKNSMLALPGSGCVFAASFDSKERVK